MQQANNPRQFSVFSAMATAPFFSGALNRDVARNWRGIGLRLLLLVLVITWIAMGIKMDRAVKHFANDEFPGVVQDFPPITIKDGVVSSPVDQPYYMKDKETGKTFAGARHDRHDHIAGSEPTMRSCCSPKTRCTIATTAIRGR